MGAGVFGDNQVKAVRAQPIAKLLGSDNDFRSDAEMHLVEFQQAALYCGCMAVHKKNMQRRMAAFGSGGDIALEASLRGRSHEKHPEKIYGSQSFPTPAGSRE
jgi:hypothetical protein